MDRERAGTFLLLLAEAELRRAAAWPSDPAVQAGCITRVIRVARVLTAVRAVGEEAAGAVLDDFELALDDIRRAAGHRGAGRPDRPGRIGLVAGDSAGPGWGPAPGC